MSRMIDENLAILKLGDTLMDLGVVPTSKNLKKFFQYIVKEEQLNLSVPPEEFLERLNFDFYSQEIAETQSAAVVSESKDEKKEEVKKTVDLDISDLF